MRAISCVLVIASCYCAQTLAGPTRATIGKSPVRTNTHKPTGWFAHESPSFRVYCHTNGTDAKRLSEACEALRSQLQETWYGSAGEEWSPRCNVVVHATVTEYVAQLGPASRQSSGCATVDVERGKVIGRRVDLRADAGDWMTSALPHELTHVVLADKFARKQIPRWADEGIAILSEPIARQATRRSAMQRALGRVPRFAAGELISMTEYPASDRRDAFYGQSASLVAYLIERDSPARFLEFLQSGQERGFQRALADVYGMHSVSELDARWRPQLLDRGQSAELLAGRIARITSGWQLD